MFADFNSLMDWLHHKSRRADMSGVAEYLADCVMQETEDLVDLELSSGKRARKSSKLFEECQRDAKEHYCEEINEFLKTDASINHWTVMAYRRKSKAWAIAKAIKERQNNE